MRESNFDRKGVLYGPQATGCFILFIILEDEEWVRSPPGPEWQNENSKILIKINKFSFLFPELSIMSHNDSFRPRDSTASFEMRKSFFLFVNRKTKKNFLEKDSSDSLNITKFWESSSSHIEIISQETKVSNITWKLLQIHFANSLDSTTFWSSTRSKYEAQEIEAATFHSAYANFWYRCF